MFFLAISSLSIYFEDKSKPNPIAASVVEFRTPRVSRSQLGVDAATQDFKMEIEPNMLIPTQLSPAAPRSPSVSCSVVEEPISVVSAVISMIPDPRSPLFSPTPPSPLFCEELGCDEGFDGRFDKVFDDMLT
jgi:hypothetical protein